MPWRTPLSRACATSRAAARAARGCRRALRRRGRSAASGLSYSYSHGRRPPPPRRRDQTSRAQHAWSLCSRERYVTAVGLWGKGCGPSWIAGCMCVGGGSNLVLRVLVVELFLQFMIFGDARLPTTTYIATLYVSGGSCELSSDDGRIPSMRGYSLCDKSQPCSIRPARKRSPV